MKKKLKILLLPMPNKISVIMSVYNGSRYLQEAVNSILVQTFNDFEFLIIDDGSTDDTWEILSKYAAKDSRIKLSKNITNIGLTQSLNKLLKLVQGDYIARMDADDVSLPIRFEKQVKTLEENLDIVLVSSELEYINSEGQAIGRSQRSDIPKVVAWNLLFYNHVGGHSQVMFRKEIIKKLGGYSADFRYAQDYELWLRLIKLGDCMILPEVLLQYRKDEKERISAKNIVEQTKLVQLASKNNLSRLTNTDISEHESVVLYNFWYRNELTGNYKLVNLNDMMKKIYKAFMEEIEQLDTKDIIANRIIFLVRKKMLFLSKKMLVRLKLLSALVTLYYVYFWRNKNKSLSFLDKNE